MKTHIFLAFFLYFLQAYYSKCMSQPAEQWFPLSTGIWGSVFEIVIDGNDVYVGGDFVDAGGNPDADYVARWDGCQWHALGAGINAAVYAITINGNDIYVGGAFTQPFSHVTKWNGSQWVAMASGLSNDVHSLLIDGNSIFASGGGYNIGFVAKWNGNTWLDLAGNLNGNVRDMVMLNSELYVGGRFSNALGDPDADGVMKWSDNVWENLGTGIQSDIFVGVWDMLAFGDDLFVGGVWINAGNNPDADKIAVWNGTQWNSLEGGPPGFLGLSALAIYDSLLYITVGAGWSNNDGIYRWDFDQELWEVFQIMELGADDPLTVLASNGTNLFAGGFSGMTIDYESYFGLAGYGEPWSNTVTSTSDNGSGSLRDIISCVPDGTTIIFALSNPSQIILTGGEILIDKNLTLAGPGVEQLTISGNNASRIFRVASGVNLEIKNLSLKNATATSNGGAVFSEGHLTLDNVLLQNNFQNGIPKGLTLSSTAILTNKGNVLIKI